MCVYKTNKLIKLRKMCMFPELGFPKTSIHPFDFLSHRLLTHSTPATLVFLLHEREIDFFRKALTHRCPFLKQYSLLCIFMLLVPSHLSYLYKIPPQRSLLDHLLKNTSHHFIPFSHLICYMRILS